MPRSPSPWADGKPWSKLNLHKAAQESEPEATHPVPGSADICLIADRRTDDTTAHLTVHQVPVEL
ncbi:MAG TPA: hypothetical protein VHU88_05065 [Sporichthyaceae bacterium]|jgi:hypothetical protein|nr:hypothetical protein [Sporichthyaceae bacterium]